MKNSVSKNRLSTVLNNIKNKFNYHTHGAPSAVQGSAKIPEDSLGIVHIKQDDIKME
jgi:hypothetical protein